VKYRRVALLMGGTSPEREVSLASGRDCAKALADCGYRVQAIDVGRDLDALLRALEPRPDAVFNALHGVGGEDGTIQGVLEMLGLPYTHSGVRASALAMHKPTAKELFARAGLPVVEGVLACREMLLARDPMPAPFVVKPTGQGSSVGVRIVPRADRPGHGRSGARRLRDRAARQLLRLHREIRGRRLGSPDPGAHSARRLRAGARDRARGPSRARLPRRQPCRSAL
jgi:D-alanine--D-alanine ligase